MSGQPSKKSPLLNTGKLYGKTREEVIEKRKKLDPRKYGYLNIGLKNEDIRIWSQEYYHIPQDKEVKENKEPIKKK